MVTGISVHGFRNGGCLDAVSVRFRLARLRLFLNFS